MSLIILIDDKIYLAIYFNINICSYCNVIAIPVLSGFLYYSTLIFMLPQ